MITILSKIIQIYHMNKSLKNEFKRERDELNYGIKCLAWIADTACSCQNQALQD